MAEVTETTVRLIEEYAARNERYPLTIWETVQLARGWSHSRAASTPAPAAAPDSVHLAAPSGQVPSAFTVDSELSALRAFALAVLDDWPEGAPDGFELQDLAVKHGLLDLRNPKPTKPCGDDCWCAEYFGADEWGGGVDCYVRTDLLLGRPTVNAEGTPASSGPNQEQAAAAVPAMTDEPTVDQCIELAGALEQRRAVQIVDDVHNLRVGGRTETMPTAFQAGWCSACEEIDYRLRTEVWAHCLPPMGFDKSAAEVSPAERQEPVSEDAAESIRLQQWDKTDGATAWHLIYRYSEGWSDTAAMMEAWLAAHVAKAAAGGAVPAGETPESFVRMLLWDDFPECCGCPVEDTGGEYMGQTETVMSCCGKPESVKLSDAQIVASLRERFPSPLPHHPDAPEGGKGGA